MTTPRPQDYARQFPENGMKLLLQEPTNVHDLLRLAGSDLVDQIDFRHLTPDPTTFVQRDYRHLESDVVLKAPLKAGKRGSLLIWILIEHQTDPDPLIPFRVLEYVVQIYRTQLRDWGREKDTLTGFQFQPVLPVVFYTGLRPWPDPGAMPDLLAGGGRFATLAPRLDLLFLSLRDTDGAKLESEGETFGQVLQLVQQRRAEPDAFRRLLERAVRGLEKLPARSRLRWLSLLSYLTALVYHEREPPEHGTLQRVIEESVRTDEHRKEARAMGKTIAQALQEEASLRSLRAVLLDLLRVRFGDVPTEVASTVENCEEETRLREWLRKLVAVDRLEQIGIRPRK